MNDDLDDDELRNALTPQWSSRSVVDDWCRRLAGEVTRRRRRADRDSDVARRVVELLMDLAACSEQQTLDVEALAEIAGKQNVLAALEGR